MLRAPAVPWTSSSAQQCSPPASSQLGSTHSSSFRLLPSCRSTAASFGRSPQHSSAPLLPCQRQQQLHRRIAICQAHKNKTGRAGSSSSSSSKGTTGSNVSSSRTSLLTHPDSSSTTEGGPSTAANDAAGSSAKQVQQPPQQLASTSDIQQQPAVAAAAPEGESSTSDTQQQHAAAPLPVAALPARKQAAGKVTAKAGGNGSTAFAAASATAGVGAVAESAPTASSSSGSSACHDGPSSSGSSSSSSTRGGSGGSAQAGAGPATPAWRAVPIMGEVAVARPLGTGALAATAAAGGDAAGQPAVLAPDGSSNGGGSSRFSFMSFDDEDLDSIEDMYGVINRASTILSEQPEPSTVLAADTAAGGSGRLFSEPSSEMFDSSSPIIEAAAAAKMTVMSFDEEDLDNIQDMYDVITRASVIVSEQKQQLQQQVVPPADIPTPSAAAGAPAGRAISPSSSTTSSPSISRSSSGSLSASLSSAELAAIAELQTATERKLADLQHVVEELDLEDDEMSQQLTDVLQKLGQLEQELSAAVHQSLSTSAASSDTEGPPPAAAAAAAGAAVLEPLPPPAVSAAVAAPVSIAHTVELEALAEAASMGARAETPLLDVLAVPLVPAPAAATAAPAAAAPGPAAAAPAAVPAALAAAAADPTKLWPLFVLGLSYVHQATSGFALPALLPMVSPDLHLTDFQGALLTSGYSYLYALALVPVGLLADKVDRPKLLAVGLGLWSTLSIVSSSAGSFAELLVARTGFAVAQAAQNPVSFSLIPDLFPNNKSTALAAYNCAIYLGRALSFASVLAAHRVRSGSGPAPAPVGTMADAAAGAAGSDGVQLSMVPLDNLDLQRMSIIYTTGDMAAVTPLYNYNFHVIAYEAAAGSGGWRELLQWIGYPGFAIALLMALTVKEPRHASEQQQGAAGAASFTDPATWKAGVAHMNMRMFNVFTGHGWQSSSSDKDNSVAAAASPAAAADEVPLAGPACVVDAHQTSALALSAAGAGAPAALALPGAAAPDTAAAVAADPSSPKASGAAAAAFMQPINSLLSKKSFQATTLAAALNDLGSYALIAWHSTFYERVFGLDSGVYAPMLAVILPVGGILGGVGGGLIADYLSVVGGRYWLTAGASLLAAPFIAQSLLADSPGGSFSALLAGFALSEAWRAPGAIMIRSVAPQELGSTASALYLCIRNLVGGVGPVAVAKLAEMVGLQHAMLLAPCCYVVSGLIFLVAEKEIEQQQKQEKLLAQQQLAVEPLQQ